MFKLIYTNSFEKDIKTAIKRGKDLGKLKKVIELLATKNPLPTKYKDHRLIGNFVGRRECY